MFDDGTLSSSDVFQTVTSGTLTRRQMATAEYTKTFTPAFVNTSRFGFSRVRADVWSQKRHWSLLQAIQAMGLCLAAPLVRSV